MTEPTWLTETRAAYDTVAKSYAEMLEDDLAGQPFHLELLADFAGRVEPGSRVADLGCGPGRVTVHLASLGLAVHGLDLSPGMVAEARRRHPGLDFEVGDLQRLPMEDGSLGGVVAWYSLIHTPPALRPTVAAELHRVLVPGGWLLAAFQVGDERIRVEQGYGHDVSFDVWRLSPHLMDDLLTEAGLEVTSLVVRPPEGPQKTPQAYLLARRR